MEGFNDVWANILNDDLLCAKDLINVPVLEPPSDLQKINLNLESNLYESSMESLIPVMPQHSNARDQMNPQTSKKTVKDDKITYSMSHASKDSIMLPQIFTKEHMQDIMTGGHDLRSPRDGGGPKANAKLRPNMGRRNIEDDISEISLGGGGHHNMKSGLLSNSESLLMDDMSRMEGAFLSELNHEFAKKMNPREEEKGQQPRYEMVKKPAPNHKRIQPP